MAEKISGNKNVMFSIIVPVYNVEKYLEKCIDSILNQDYDHYEVILIDDGSTDGSSAICDRYANKYHHVITFHKENGGLSDARNYGMKKASGDYLIFIDSDDWIEQGCLSKFAKVISENMPDVLLTRVTEAYEDKKIDKDEDMVDFIQSPVTRSQVLKFMLEHSHHSVQAQLKIISKAYVNENKLQFLTGRLHEDIDWTAKICCTAQTYAISDYRWYNYRMEREGAITNSIKGKNIIDVIEIAAMHYAYYQENKSQVSRMVLSKSVRSTYYSIHLIGRCSDEDKKLVADCIKKNINVLSFTSNMKHKLFYYFMKMLGVENALKFLEFFS